MTDENLWREEGPKAFLEFLRTATGEDHDAAVYDTKVEFDPSNPDALRYVASIAMSKGSLGVEHFSAPMPNDDSIAPIDAEGGNENVQWNRSCRLCSEAHPTGPCIYVPATAKYRKAVLCAIQNREIPYEDMTKSERRHSKLNNFSESLELVIWELRQCFMGKLLLLFVFVLLPLYLILMLIEWLTFGEVTSLFPGAN